jgi:hypothetical protein
VPVVNAMNRALAECQLRSNRPRLLTALMTNTRAQFDADISLMTGTASASRLVKFICPPKPLMLACFKLFRSAGRTRQNLALTRIYLIEC